MILKKYYSIFLLVLLFSACGDCPEHIFVDRHSLSDESIEVRPYIGVDSLFFVDKNMEEHILLAGDYEFIKDRVTVKTLCEDRAAIQYEFWEKDFHTITVSSKTNNLNFSIQNRLLNLDNLTDNDASATGFSEPTNPDSLKVYDVLTVSTNAGTLLDVLFDDRNLPMIDITKSPDFNISNYFGDTIILDKFFTDVHGMINDQTNEQLFYTKELGLVAVKFADDGVWVLDKTN